MNLSERGFRVALIVFTGLGLFLRFHGLSAQPIWQDEIAMWMEALGLDAGTADAFLPRSATYALMWLRHDTTFLTLRFLPAFFGGMAVYVTGLLGRELGQRAELPEKMVGIIAAALMAILPFAVHLSRQGRPYGFMLFFAALMYLTFFRATNSRSVVAWAWFGLSAGLAASCHYVTLHILIGLGICLLVRGIQTRDFFPVSGFVVSTVLGCIPTLFGLRPQHTWHTLDTTYPLPWNTFLTYFLEGVSPAPRAAALTLALLILGLLVLYRKGARLETMALATVTAISVLLTYCFLGVKGTWGRDVVRYLCHLSVPVVLSCALATVWAGRKWRIPTLLVATIYFGLALASFFPGENRREYYAESAQYVKSLPGLSGVIVDGNRTLSMFGYFYSDSLPVFVIHRGGVKSTASVPSRGNLRSLLKASTWVTLSPGLYALVGDYATDLPRLCRDLGGQPEGRPLMILTACRI